MYRVKQEDIHKMNDLFTDAEIALHNLKLQVIGMKAFYFAYIKDDMIDEESERQFAIVSSLEDELERLINEVEEVHESTDFFDEEDKDDPSKENFIDDAEKMADFVELTKSEFLSSYSYLTEQEYNNTRNLVSPISYRDYTIEFNAKNDEWFAYKTSDPLDENRTAFYDGETPINQITGDIDFHERVFLKNNLFKAD